MTTLGLIVTLCLVVAVLTAATTALRSVSSAWLRHWAELQLSGAGGDPIGIDRPQRLVLSSGTAIAGTVFAMGAFIGLREEGAAQLEFLLGATALLLTIGQLLPRAIARRWPARMSALTLPSLRVVEWLFTPLLVFAERLAMKLPISRGAAAPLVSRGSVDELLRDAEVEGLSVASERAIIAGVLDFGELQAIDVMTSRKDIVGIDVRTTASEVAAIVARAKYSRVPVYNGNIDHIIGLVHSFDVLANPERPLASLRPVLAATPEEPCDDLMRRLLREHAHLAIVRSGDGETQGLVTLDDLVEKLVGDIRDEHDDVRGDVP